MVNVILATLGPDASSMRWTLVMDHPAPAELISSPVSVTDMVGRVVNPDVADWFLVALLKKFPINVVTIVPYGTPDSVTVTCGTSGPPAYPKPTSEYVIVTYWLLIRFEIPVHVAQYRILSTIAVKFVRLH